MKYEIGQKVTTPLGNGEIIDVFTREDKTIKEYKVCINTYNVWVDVKDIKPYKTTHDKLIELGWKHFDEDKMGVIYENENAYLNIYKTHKYYIFETKESGKYIENKVEIDLELSRILTEYLEWLEEEK